MDESEERQFKAIAMGELAGNDEFMEATNLAAHYACKAFAMLKSYGIESREHITYVCQEAGIPVLTLEPHSHMRDHLG